MVIGIMDYMLKNKNIMSDTRIIIKEVKTPLYSTTGSSTTIVGYVITIYYK
jgi:hypothetical protein